MVGKSIPQVRPFLYLIFFALKPLTRCSSSPGRATPLWAIVILDIRPSLRAGAGAAFRVPQGDRHMGGMPLAAVFR
jgi:hypothetical protein